jgi:hypothetical protein
MNNCTHPIDKVKVLYFEAENVIRVQCGKCGEVIKDVKITRTA